MALAAQGRCLVCEPDALPPTQRPQEPPREFIR